VSVTEPLRVAFCSANGLLDPSSGAAISVTTVLELLAEQGVECASFTASTFDAAFSDDPAKSLSLLGARPQSEEAADNIWVKHEGGVDHRISLSPSTSRGRLESAFEEQLLADGIAFLEQWRPTAIITYGNGLFEHRLAEAAKARGITTLFYLANPSYASKAAFTHIDQVLTDTEATKTLYENRLGLQSVAIGKFIRKPVIPQGLGAPQYVTFVNPSFAKGVTLFYRIVELARSIIPEAKFLVVESRATLAESEQRTGMRFSSFPTIRRIGLQKDMSAVLGMTKVLLMPSLWHESGGRTALEAAALGIPAVVSNRGGLPEVLGDAAIQIAPPEPLIHRHELIPPLSEAIPWVEAIRQLLTDPEFYGEHSAAALERWQTHDPSARIRAIIELIQRLRPTSDR
jgi:glycosyltransferase involved in cell wall biosynthesis